jgi:hypothetical protein
MATNDPDRLDAPQPEDHLRLESVPNTTEGLRQSVVGGIDQALRMRAVTLFLSADTIRVIGGLREFVQTADTPTLQKMLDDVNKQP